MMGKDEKEEMLNLEECVMPVVELLVNGQKITFLCDTGATRTVLRDDVKGTCPSGSTVSVRSANGNVVWITDPETEKSHRGSIVISVQ